MNAVSERQHAHELIDRLSASETGTVVRFLEFMLLHPVARAAATAPPDDEPATEQDRQRFQDGQSRLAESGGKWIPMEDVLADFGMTPEDLNLSLER